MNTNFNYQFNCACDEISSRSRRPIQRAKFHVRRIPKLIRRIYYFYKFTDFDDCLKNIFTYFFKFWKKNLYPTLRNKNFHNEFWKFSFEFLSKVDFYFELIREINYRPRSRDPWDNLQEWWQESTFKNKRSETGNSNLIVDTPGGTWLIRHSSRFTDSRSVYTWKGLRLWQILGLRFWERIRDISFVQRRLKRIWLLS